MVYLALAADGDGTLTRGGVLGQRTIAALKRWRAAGRKLLLVTGETPQQLCDFPHHQLFDAIVAENGALLLNCRRRQIRRLAPKRPRSLLRALRRAGVQPLKPGRVIIESEMSQAEEIRQVLSRLRIKWRIVANRKAIMIVPNRITKATGLAVALQHLKIAPRHVVAFGDAENDVPMIKCSGLGVAVHNAVPILKKNANVVSRGSYGRGCVEIVERLLSNR